MDILKRLNQRYGGWVPRIGMPNNKVGRNEVSKKKSINRALKGDRNIKTKIKKYRRKG